MSARKPDRNRQALIVCEPCGYKLRGSRTQLARGIPACPLCGGRMFPDDFQVASVVLAPDELESHPEFETRAEQWAVSERKSMDAQAGPCRVDRGMSDRWLRERGISPGGRQWSRDDFAAMGASLVVNGRTAEPIPF